MLYQRWTPTSAYTVMVVQFFSSFRWLHSSCNTLRGLIRTNKVYGVRFQDTPIKSLVLSNKVEVIIKTSSSKTHSFSCSWKYIEQMVQRDYRLELDHIPLTLCRVVLGEILSNFTLWMFYKRVLFFVQFKSEIVKRFRLWWKISVHVLLVWKLIKCVVET